MPLPTMPSLCTDLCFFFIFPSFFSLRISFFSSREKGESTMRIGVEVLLLVLLVLLTAVNAFCPAGAPVQTCLARAFALPPHICRKKNSLQCRRWHQQYGLRALGGEDGPGEDDGLGMDELASRIQKIEDAKARSVEALAEGLQLRANELREAKETEELVIRDKAANLPVVVFDALLPNQRLEGSTTDPTFCRFLRDLALGGMFVMVSWNPYKRRARRNGVLVRIEFVDSVRIPDATDLSVPTSVPSSVDFIMVGLMPARVVGPAVGMEARVGHWRREYDPDGEQHLLGWGSERFLDAQLPPEWRTGGGILGPSEAPACPDVTSPSVAWSSTEVLCLPTSDCAAEETAADAVALALFLIPLLDKWFFLASDQDTYAKEGVTASARTTGGRKVDARHCDPLKRLKGVVEALGDRPPPTEPTAFAFWGAALINPLPPLVLLCKCFWPAFYRAHSICCLLESQ